MTFLKPFRIKSNTQMKGSDKKKLKATLLQQFLGLSEEDLNSLLPTKDEIILSKVYTFSGESLLLYIHGKNTVFFQFEKEPGFLPTVYTLWKHPELLPVVTTWTPVMGRIANGADLMLPGIIVNEDKGIKAYCDGKLVKGDYVSVNLQNNSAPIAVGRTHLSSEDMYMAAKRGKGVEIIHFYGDQLWASGSRVEVPDLGSPDLSFLKKTEYEGEMSEEEGEEVNEDRDGVEDGEAGEASDTIPPVKPTEAVPTSPVEAVTSAVSGLSVEAGDSRSPQDVMDQLLHSSFNQAWKTTAKRVEFPILTSNFFRLHMVKNCPPECSLDVKKSSYKKLSKFLAEKEKYGVIHIKELQKGVESIVGVNYDHEDIVTHRVIKYHKEVAEPEEVLPCDKEYEPPKIVELHTVNATVQKIFSSCGISKGAGLTSQEVRQVVVSYVKAADLQLQNNKGSVKVDAILGEVVLGKGENNVVEMKWDEITQRIISKMSDGYSLQFPGQPSQVYKGRLEPVQLTTATRSGNKKITLVYNLETYKIDPTEFAHKCQVGVAASTTVNPAANRKTGSEVMIQGNQISFASKLLMEEYKIPKKYIKGIENAPKKKK